MARPTLTKAHRGLLGLVAAGACIISGIGFAGSYNAVRELAEKKGFGAFSYAFPIGVDAGIVVLLALDLVLTWLRIPFPMLRQTAWLLTVATIAFNAAASWGDPLGMGMHAVIPVLFVVVVEASRHAVGRIAAITADRHMESVRVMRWILSPVPTFRLWRRMKLWELRSYDEVIRLEQNRLVYRAQLRFRYGRGWRRSAPIQALLPLKLAKFGVPLDPSLLDRLDDEGRELEAKEVATTAQAELEAGEPELQEIQVAAAIAPAQAAVVAQPQHAQQAVPPQHPQHPQHPQFRPEPGQPQAQVQPQQLPQPQVQPQPQAQVQQPQAQQPQATAPAPATVPPVPVEVAGPVLAKLAAVRRRAENEPADEPEETPQQRGEELDVWAARQVRPAGHRPDAAPAAPAAPVAPAQASPVPATPAPVDVVPVAPAVRTPAKSSPWFNAGAPAPEESAGAPAEEPAAADQPVPVPASAHLDLDVAYEGLLSYIDNNGHQPDAQRLAEWLTTEHGVTGKGPDGSVHPKEVADLYPKLNERYQAAGRD
ncbi:hypothetical protein VM98_19685 [Streptomyces rubellomurinus subsp. indigoferus]|nr:hypothetical protein VM98_19685 [Streptomyces rubellomurinus subsp. indigoferus]